MLTVEDVRQSADDATCGHVAACVDCRFFGRPDPPSLANDVQGTPPDTLEAVLRRSGMCILSGTMGLIDLQHLTLTRPVLCPVSIDGGHWVVVCGVYRRRVYYHDPLKGMQFRTFTFWRDIWHDTTRYGHAYDNWGICASPPGYPDQP